MRFLSPTIDRASCVHTGIQDLSVTHHSNISASSPLRSYSRWYKDTQKIPNIAQREHKLDYGIDMINTTGGDEYNPDVQLNTEPEV